jgi:hypothetical protein
MATKLQVVRIRWKRYASYEDARKREFVVYLHEWKGKPFYWGKTRVTFGQDGKRAGRYGAGYKHWIEGCLRHGGRLYIGEPVLPQVVSLNEVENHLIVNYPSVMQQKPKERRLGLRVENSGERPSFLPRSFLSANR